MIPIQPTPAPHKYKAAGQPNGHIDRNNHQNNGHKYFFESQSRSIEYFLPNPPAPTINTLAFLS